VAGFDVFENLSVLPRYFFVSGVGQADDREIERLIRSGEVDLRRAAFTEEKPPVTASGAIGTVRTIAYEPNSLELEVKTQSASFLVLSEEYYPGWQASIDGAPSKIYRTDLAFRGMAIPAGTHRVRMEFRPSILTAGCAVSACTLILLLLVPQGFRRIQRGRTTGGQE